MRAAPEFPWLLVLRLQLDDVMTTIEIDTPTGPIDALLGQLCIRHELTLLTTDADFSLAARHCPLRVWSPAH